MYILKITKYQFLCWGKTTDIARANNGILVGNDLPWDMMKTENKVEMKREAEKRKLHRMVKVHDFLEMGQGSQNLRATQKESCAQNR